MVSGRNFNSPKLSCMSSLPARMRMIESKMKELECSQDFSLYRSMGIFPEVEGQLTLQSLVRSGRISNCPRCYGCPRHLQAANSAVLGPILSNFELVRDVMDVLVTCKYEEDPIKNEGARVHNIFPIITLWELSIAMETRVPNQSGPKPNAAFHPPQ